MPRKVRDTGERRPSAETAERMASGFAADQSRPSQNNQEPLAFAARDTLTLSQLRYFMAVCETLSFTHAARKCGISQPALLRAIRKLENALGARLFRLESARLRPTELAQLLRPQLQLILATAEAAKEAAGKFAAENPATPRPKRKRQ